MKEILDAGSGARPYAQATVLCDLHVKASQHREGIPAKLDGRPFVCCDLHHLPFKDLTFDFVYCWHVLEHVAHPNRVLKELKRVGRKGFAAAPSKLWQFMFPNNPSHHWIIGAKGTHKRLQHNRPLARLIAYLWRINWRIKFRERLKIEWFGIRANVHDQVIRW